jgi:putative cardiolipin synthase
MLVFSQLLALLLALLPGCASVDFDADKSTTYALTDTDDTYLGSYVSQLGDHPAGYSGFYLLGDGMSALALRLLLELHAARSIDVQYYTVADDIIGQVFFASLVRAADRGVRVRLLIDDINTGGMDDTLAVMDQHPNIELRLFNPFAHRNLRFLDIGDFSRVNRRMHNKSFTVDNQVTIIGGRNIATEYFVANDEYNFSDMDLLAVGPVVDETSRMFDAFWNHRNAVPYRQLSGKPEDGGERLMAFKASLKDNSEALRDTPYAAAVVKSLNEMIGDDDSFFEWAAYQLVYDSPDKSISDEAAENAASITTPLRASIMQARESLLVVSPYFVPRQSGINTLSEIQDSGVQVDILTNSLASSDHLLVHSGYAGCRKPLLAHGVRIFEMRGDVHVVGTRRAGTQGSSSSLHAKAFIVDNRYFFMGSFNWDPRSAEINTELGVIIDSPKIASQMAASIMQAVPTKSYEVFLNDDGELRWRAGVNGRVETWDREPETSFYTRFKAGLLGILPVESQL